MRSSVLFSVCKPFLASWPRKRSSSKPDVVCTLHKWLFLYCCCVQVAHMSRCMGVHKRFQNKREQALYTTVLLWWVSSLFALPLPHPNSWAFLLSMAADKYSIRSWLHFVKSYLNFFKCCLYSTFRLVTRWRSAWSSLGCLRCCFGIVRFVSKISWHRVCCSW